MIVSSRGIVLSSLRYSDSSFIARIYTLEKGLRSFMVRTGKGKKALVKLSLLQPLSLVEIGFADDDRKTLHTLRSIEREESFQSIPFDPLKTCIALFVAEIVYRSIGEEEQNPELFRFLRNAVLLLDDDDSSVANFHLKFIIEFSRFLGIYPQQQQVNQLFFDLVEGEFCATQPIHPHAMTPEQSTGFSKLLSCGMSKYSTVKITNQTRRELLQKLLDYYRLHLDGMKELASHKVLEEVLS